jgi:hypothetical protein
LSTFLQPAITQQTLKARQRFKIGKSFAILKNGGLKKVTFEK